MLQTSIGFDPNSNSETFLTTTQPFRYPMRSITLPDFRTLLSKGRKHPNQRVILLHGEGQTIVSPCSGICSLPAADLDNSIVKFSNPLILFAAPFAFTYLKQTIHLQKHELLQADQQTLGFSRFPIEYRLLESISLDSGQAITCLTHLSDSGHSALKRLKRQKLRFRWQPAISFIARQLVTYSHPDLQQYLRTILVMNREVLQFEWHESLPVFKHLFGWVRDETPLSLQTKAERLLDATNRASSSLVINLSERQPGDLKPDETVQHLLCPVGKPKPVKITKKQYKRSRWLTLRKIRLRYPALAITLFLLFWTAWTSHKLFQLKSQRLELMKTVKALRHSTAGLEQITRQERSLLKVEALIETVQLSSFDPVDIIKRLQQLIPESAWFHSVKMDRYFIRFQILDNENSSVADTIKRLTNAFGEVRLDDNAVLRIEPYSIRTRTLTITYSNTDEP